MKDYIINIKMLFASIIRYVKQIFVHKHFFIEKIRNKI